MPAIGRAEIVRGPGDDVWLPGADQLIAAGTAVLLDRSRPAHRADGVPLSPELLVPLDTTAQRTLRSVRLSPVLTGHYE
jgi:hypothetical protein